MEVKCSRLITAMETKVDEHLHLISQPDHPEKGNFVTQLGKKFEFSASDRIYLGLKELSISCQLKSESIAPGVGIRERLRVAVGTPHLLNGVFQLVDIDAGHYSRQALVDYINSQICRALGPKFYPNDCRLWYNRTTKLIEFFVNGACKDVSRRITLVILPPLSTILGLQHKDEPPRSYLIGANSPKFPLNQSLHSTHAFATYEPTVKSIDLIFVYLSVLKQTCVGNQLAPICDIFPKTDCISGHSYLTYRVVSPKYIQLANNLRSLKEIQVLLTSETGDELIFDPGSVDTRLTLHLVSEEVLRRQ